MAQGAAGSAGLITGTGLDANGNTYTTTGNAEIGLSTTFQSAAGTINFTAASPVLSSGGTAGSQVTGSATFNATTGATVVVGNTAFTFSAASINAALQAAGLSGAPNVTVTVSTVPSNGAPVPGGPGQFSVNGTLFQVTITAGGARLLSDVSWGEDSAQAAPPATSGEIKVFPSAIDITFLPNAADLTMARGNLNNLTMAYLIDQNTPAIGNPNHYPVGTWVLFPPESVTRDQATGLIDVRTNHFTIMSAFTNPVGWVQTLAQSTGLWSSFDPGTSVSFGAKPQFTYLQVAEPQIGSRLVVFDPATNNYAYVNATDVGPSGPPPQGGKGAAAVVRSLVE